MTSSTHLRSSARWAVLVGLGALLAASPTAAAGRANPNVKQAKQAFESAQRAYQLGRFQEALAGYERAFELSGKDGLLFNLGQCHRQLAHWERAAFFYRRFLAAVRRTHPHAKLATHLLAEVEQRQLEAAAEKQRLKEAERLAKVAEAERLAAERQRAEAMRLHAEAEREQAEALRVQLEFRSKDLSLTPTSGATEGLSAQGVPGPKPITSRWYFWAGLGAVLVGAGATAYVATTPPRPDPTSLGEIRY